MIESLAWLGLAIGDDQAAAEFYEPLLGSGTRTDRELRYTVAGTDLRLRLPEADPPGGDHVHYAFGTGPAGYTRYKEILADLVPVEEHELGAYHSAYGFDPDGHCVEFADRAERGRDIAGIFEIVLEVANLEDAEAWYRLLEPELMDRGTDRRRVRLDLGPFELELWEPQRGLADARPGAHVDIGLRSDSPDQMIERLADGAIRVEDVSNGRQVVDGDGHMLTILGS